MLQNIIFDILYMTYFDVYLYNNNILSIKGVKCTKDRIITSMFKYLLKIKYLKIIRTCNE